MTGKELDYITEAIQKGSLSGDGFFTQECQQWLECYLGCTKALLTHSCTAALEMSAILADIRPGDEVIMPSYTFVSTANAFVLRGAVPVFFDIRPDTLNIDENLIEAAITPKTKAIIPVHYAGVGCEMDKIMDIAACHNLLVIEDAAQGLISLCKGRKLGSIGHMATFSFHATKNIIAGEGGALIINDPLYAKRAEVIREKGTNRSQFFRGEVDKYSWTDIGSSYLPSELVAAFLWAQLEQADDITQRRLAIWKRYDDVLRPLATDQDHTASKHTVQTIPKQCIHNAHMYYILLKNPQSCQDFIRNMKANDISTVFHYVPLHSAPYGQKCSRTSGDMTVTDDLAARLVRLPLWIGVEHQQDYILDMAVLSLKNR